MKILVIGASKGIGLEAVRIGLERGHAMRAMARGADAMELGHPALEKMAGDATEPGDVAQAVAGVDAVVQTLGVPKGPGMLFGSIDLFSRSTRALISAMRQAGVRRLVSVTGFGAGESRARVSALESVPFRLILGRAYADKDLQERLIRESGLDWTIARPTVLTNGPRTGRYRVLVEPGAWRNGLISRADVADFLIGEVESGACLRKCPVLAY